MFVSWHGRIGHIVYLCGSCIWMCMSSHVTVTIKSPLKTIGFVFYWFRVSPPLKKDISELDHITHLVTTVLWNTTYHFRYVFHPPVRWQIQRLFWDPSVRFKSTVPNIAPLLEIEPHLGRVVRQDNMWYIVKRAEFKWWAPLWLDLII